MSWAQNVLGTESLIWAQNVQAQNRRLKIAGTESLGTKSGTFIEEMYLWYNQLFLSQLLSRPGGKFWEIF